LYRQNGGARPDEISCNCQNGGARRWAKANKTRLWGLQALGGTQLASDYYWSSSQGTNHKYSAWLLYFSDGSLFTYDKDDDSRVCCVRAFSN